MRSDIYKEGLHFYMVLSDLDESRVLLQSKGGLSVPSKTSSE